MLVCNRRKLLQRLCVCVCVCVCVWLPDTAQHTFRV